MTESDAPHIDGPSHRRRHPVAGGLWGILFGCGLALLAINFKLVALGLAPAISIVVFGVVIGVVWGMFGPAKQPRGVPPAGP